MNYVITIIAALIIVSCSRDTRRNEIIDLLNAWENSPDSIGDDSQRDNQFNIIAKLFSELSDNEKLDIQSSVNGNKKIYLQIIDGYVEKWRVIQDGWSRDIEYYQSIRKSILTTLPKDGGHHYFKIQWDDGRPRVNVVPNIPGGRCESDWYGCGMIMPNGDLEAFYIFSDMGHAGVWGVIITPRMLKEDDNLSRDELIGWIFVRLGKQIHPGIYEAETNLD